MNFCFFTFNTHFICKKLFVCMSVGAREQVQGPEKWEDDIGSPTVGVSSLCKLFGMASGNWTWVLCESSMYSNQMMTLSSPYKVFNVSMVVWFWNAKEGFQCYLFRWVARKDFKRLTTGSAEPLKIRSINARFSKGNDQGNNSPESLEGYYSRILNLTLSIGYRMHTKD